MYIYEVDTPVLKPRELIKYGCPLGGSLYTVYQRTFQDFNVLFFDLR